MVSAVPQRGLECLSHDAIAEFLCLLHIAVYRSVRKFHKIGGKGKYHADAGRLLPGYGDIKIRARTRYQQQIVKQQRGGKPYLHGDPFIFKLIFRGRRCDGQPRLADRLTEFRITHKTVRRSVNHDVTADRLACSAPVGGIAVI